MLELVAGILLAAATAVFVILPVLRPPLRDDADAADESGAEADDDVSPRAVALRALKEIEFDRATGKLSDADYASLKAKYTAGALAALREEHGAVSTEQKAAPVVRSVLRAPCSVHGPRPESDALFCSECGRRLAAAPGFCIRCGTALAADSRYCNHCGARVAA